jgi:hypothetical protein
MDQIRQAVARPPARSEWTRRLLPLLYTLAVALLWMASAGRPFYFPLDDAYITLHNARALWAGGDFNYGVSPLVGATSLVHLAIVAALLPLMDPVRADIAVCLSGALLYLWGVERLAFRHGLSLAATAALLLVAAGTASMVFHLCNGLETSLVLAGVTWAILLADREAPSRALCLLAGILPFLHPELGVLSAALLLRQAWRRRTEPGRLRAIAVDVALALAAASPWLAWSWLETGSVIPNTAAAKVAFFADAQRPLGWKVLTTAWAIVSGIGPAFPALAFARRSSLALALWAFALVFLTASLLLYASGLVGYGGRYVVVLLPACLWALCDWSGSRRVQAMILAAWALVSCAGVFQSQRLLRTLDGMSADEAAAVAWAERNLPHDQTVLVHDAGISAYASTLKLCDLVGLKTPAAMAVHQAMTGRNEALRGAAIARIAADCRARFAIVHDAPFWSAVTDDLQQAGWRTQLLRPRGAPGGYDVYRLIRPG